MARPLRWLKDWIYARWLGFMVRRNMRKMGLLPTRITVRIHRIPR